MNENMLIEDAAVKILGWNMAKARSTRKKDIREQLLQHGVVVGDAKTSSHPTNTSSQDEVVIDLTHHKKQTSNDDTPPPSQHQDNDDTVTVIAEPSVLTAKLAVPAAPKINIQNILTQPIEIWGPMVDTLCRAMKKYCKITESSDINDIVKNTLYKSKRERLGRIREKICHELQARVKIKNELLHVLKCPNNDEYFVDDEDKVVEKDSSINNIYDDLIEMMMKSLQMCEKMQIQLASAIISKVD